jgi:hypothetical protein
MPRWLWGIQQSEGVVLFGFLLTPKGPSSFEDLWRFITKIDVKIKVEDFGFRLYPFWLDNSASNSGSQKTFYFFTFLSWIFFINSLQSSQTYHQLEKVLRHMEFTREMLKDQLYLCNIQKKNFGDNVVDLSTFL